MNPNALIRLNTTSPKPSSLGRDGKAEDVCAPRKFYDRKFYDRKFEGSNLKDSVLGIEVPRVFRDALKST